MTDAHIYCLVAAPEAAVYLVPDGGGWALPHVALSLRAGISYSPPEITAAVAALTGGEVEFLLSLSVTAATDAAPAEAVVVLSVTAAALPPASPLWRVPLAGARQGTWARPDHQSALAALAFWTKPARGLTRNWRRTASPALARWR